MNTGLTDLMNATKTLSQFRRIFKCLMEAGITPTQAAALRALQQSAQFRAPPTPTSSSKEDVFADGSLQEFISQNLDDPWKDTCFEGYVYLSPKQKGEFGERFFEKYFLAKGHEVQRAATATDSYDRLIDGLKVEMKFSLATRNKKDKGVKPDNFIINHVSKGKNFDRLVFCCINGQDQSQWTIKWLTHADFVAHVENKETSLFRHQQGGQGVENDDFMCSGKGISQLLNHEMVKDISEW